MIYTAAVTSNAIDLNCETFSRIFYDTCDVFVIRIIIKINTIPMPIEKCKKQSNDKAIGDIITVASVA